MAKQKKTASQIGRSSRQKGKRGERAVAAAFRELYGDSVRRGWQAREGEDDPDVVGVPGWWVEVKTMKRVNVRAAFEQAVEDLGDKPLKPVVIAKDDGRETLAVLRFEDYLELLRQASPLETVSTNTLMVPGRSTADPSVKKREAMYEYDAPRVLNVFMPAQPGDHRDRPAGHDDGTA